MLYRVEIPRLAVAGTGIGIGKTTFTEFTVASGIFRP